MKNLIFSKYKQLSILFVFTIIAGVLLMTRIKITQSFYLLFLVWNLFLAAIPYGITFLIQLRKNWFTSKWVKVGTFLFWLLFLPNAPYIVSDFTHLQWTSQKFIFLDTAIITCFSLLGLLYMVYSIKDMQEAFLNTLSRKQHLLFLISLCILLGFGIYLGRYLRWNSWDIMRNPIALLYDISQILIHPIQNKIAWIITGVYATLSGFSIIIINRYRGIQ